MDVTREEFEAYEKVRQSGDFNMIMEQRDAAATAGLTLDRYRAVMKQYAEARTKYSA